MKHLAPLAVFALCGFSLGCEKHETIAPKADPNAPMELLLPEHGAYTGAFVDFGEAEDTVALETIENFE